MLIFFNFRDFCQVEYEPKAWQKPNRELVGVIFYCNFIGGFVLLMPNVTNSILEYELNFKVKNVECDEIISGIK